MDDFKVPKEEDQPEHVTAVSYKDLNEIIETTATAVTIGDKTYYYLPYWFTKAPGGSGWYFYSLDHAPKELQEFIVKSRLGGDNPQPDYKLLSGITLTEEEKKWMKDGKITDDEIST